MPVFVGRPLTTRAPAIFSLTRLQDFQIAPLHLQWFYNNNGVIHYFCIHMVMLLARDLCGVSGDNEENVRFPAERVVATNRVASGWAKTMSRKGSCDLVFE